MAQYNAPGEQIIEADAKRITRKVVVTTGEAPQPPGAEGVLTNISITKEPGGIQRGIYEYTLGGIVDGNSSYDIYGKRIELSGGTREVPIQSHYYFSTLTEQQLLEVEEKVAGTSSPTLNEKQQVLFDFLRRKIEYVLAPSSVGRVTEMETSLPSLKPLAKVANPPELDAPSGTFWVCTSITASKVGARYEVTREYTTVFSSWEDITLLYGWGSQEEEPPPEEPPA